MTTLREAAQRLLEARDRFGWSVEVDAYFHKLRDVLASERQAEPKKQELFCAFGTYDGRPIALADYAGRTESEVISKVFATARREGYKGTAAARMKSLGWTIGPLYTHPAPPVEQPTIPIPDDIDAQDWAGMDGAIAYHLIERHSETWDHAGRLMRAWRDANPPAVIKESLTPEQPGAVALSDDDIEWPDTESAAHSCVQEALSFGLNYDVIHRHMLSVMFKTAGACRAALVAAQPAAPAERNECWCHTCRPVTFSDMRMVLCPTCGNKRCPHANNHANACTGSNEPGQPGSAYPGPAATQGAKT